MLGKMRSALIRVMDNGIGLPEDRARLFEPGGPLRQALEGFLAPLGSNP